MHLEHNIMRAMVRISHSGRRKLQGQETKDHRHRGYGHILDILSKHTDITQQALSQMLGIRPQSASEAVSSLEEQGLIEKLPNPMDKRSCLLRITPEGLKRRGEMLAQMQENACRVLAPLSDEEKQTLRTLLEKVVAELEKNKEEM